jgi:predicted nucleic acid-binding protein
VIRELLGRYDETWSSVLIIIELRRLARREDLTAPADRMLASMRLHAITDAAIERAARLEPLQLRTLDAIHLEAAIDLHGAGSISTVLTHDEQLRNACTLHGIPLAIP